MSNNPLSKYFRKPTFYMQIPTRGIFNPEFEQTALEEIAILPMTTLDELTLKNPDALLNGEAMIDVIRSCVPSIPNPRNVCNIDAEALFLGIRHATYGSEIEQEHKCSSCEETNSYTIDIGYILNQFPSIDEVPTVEFEDLVISLRPPSIQSISQLALINIEQQRMIREVMKVANGEEKVSDAEQLTRKYQDSFAKIANYNMELLSAAINYVETPEGERITGDDLMAEFIRNVPATLADEINQRISNLTVKPSSAETMRFNCPECGHEDDIKVEMNPVNFSVAG